MKRFTLFCPFILLALASWGGGVLILLVWIMQVLRHI